VGAQDLQHRRCCNTGPLEAIFFLPQRREQPAPAALEGWSMAEQHWFDGHTSPPTLLAVSQPSVENGTDSGFSWTRPKPETLA